MKVITTFDSTKEALRDILQGIKTGKTQLPDFQRGWVWDDAHIRSLLASLGLSYPIGTVMFLQTGNPEVKFKPRLLEGVQLSTFQEPERLILDGQQRLTSLYQALLSNQAVTTFNSKGREIKRWYYLNIHQAINPYSDLEEAIVSLPEDRKVYNFRGEVIADYSTEEKEGKAGLFPLSLIFENSLINWQMKYIQSNSDETEKRLKIWEELTPILQSYQQYQMPIIFLRKETPKDAVCQVFEKVNTGGVSLSVFELLTATFAADDYSLRDDWNTRQQELNKYPVLESIESTDFLQVISLLTTRYKRESAIEDGIEREKAPAISCKRKDVLRLTLDDYKHWADLVIESYKKVAKLLHHQGIFTARDLPYRSQLIPMAAIFAVLGERGENDGVREKISRWFWCGVFGELYGGSIETRFARDLPEVLRWLDGVNEPTTAIDANFSPNRLLTLKTRNSAAYKGLYALLIGNGSQDFLTGQAINSYIYFEEKIDIHHIFPREWCRKNQIDSQQVESVINKTPIAAKTNRIIKDRPPSNYLERIQKKAEISSSRLNEILASHFIDPQPLKMNDFEGFFTLRKQALLLIISEAMGKPIAPEINS